MNVLRWSVVFFWLWTAVVSVVELHGQSAQLLRGSTVSAAWQSTVIIAGASLDLLIGVWIALRPSARAYGFAFATVVLLSLLASLVDPALWLNPLGPLSKNLPILAALWLLWRSPETRR